MVLAAVELIAAEGYRLLPAYRFDPRIRHGPHQAPPFTVDNLTWAISPPTTGKTAAPGSASVDEMDLRQARALRRRAFLAPTSCWALTFTAPLGKTNR